MEFQGNIEDHTGRSDQKRFEYHESAIAIFSSLVLSCSTFVNSVDIDDVNTCNFTFSLVLCKNLLHATVPHPY